MNNSAPSVSIVVPNYNYARYLPERMESIFNQSFQDYEVILLDDCSTDNSREIIEKYRFHPKVSAIVYNDCNSGSPFRQWQKGVEMARGKYVWIAEADDSAKPQFLASGVELLEQHPEAVIAYIGSTIMDENSNIYNYDLDRWKRKQRSPKGYRILNGPEYVRRNLYWFNYVYNASGALFRRECATADMFEQCGTMHNSGDWFFWSMLVGKGDIIEIYKRLNIYRRYPGNTTAKGINSGIIRFEDIKVIRYIESQYNIGGYRKMLRHGLLMKTIKRAQYDDKLKQRMLEQMRTDLGATETDYRVERINKYLWHIFPFLPTKYTDRM